MIETSFTLLEISLRLGAASLAGFIIGLDREMTDRPAGLRTHMLVSVAAAMFTLISFEIVLTAQELDGSTNSDPVRVVEAVLTGVAFLGAGTIIRAGRKVQGVTTGASIWLVGALGVACGGGYYLIALAGGVLAFLILTVLGFVERKLAESSKDG
ncbi:MAG: MgtC/SapB family protein [Azospirillaceae bacterium]